MAKPHALKEIEQRHGRSLHDIIPPLVNEMGSAKAAAKQLGVADSTITTWLKEHGYIRITHYVMAKSQKEN